MRAVRHSCGHSLVGGEIDPYRTVSSIVGSPFGSPLGKNLEPINSPCR